MNKIIPYGKHFIDDDDINAAGPGDDYIYIAIAAEPLVGDSPATAN